MNNFYYLFSKSGSNIMPLETLYMCDGENYIDKPLFKTGVYPVGTFLSRTVNLLTPWYRTNFSAKYQIDELYKSIYNYKSPSTSFSKATEKDQIFQCVFRTLFAGESNIQTNKNYDQIIRGLRNYMDFISLCYENHKLCTSINLSLLANQNGCIMPQSNLFTDELITSNENLKKEDINKLLSESDNLGYSFDPDFVKRPKRIFKLDNSEIDIQNDETLLTPIYVFPIHDAVDLIVASLKCIFEVKYFVGKCNFCGELYVANNRKIKYCPQKNNMSSSCQKLGNERKQLLRNRSDECKRMYNSIRTMLGNKYGYGEDGNTETPYSIFCRNSQEWRHNIKTGKATVKEYEEWLKAQYKRKYK